MNRRDFFKAVGVGTVGILAGAGLLKAEEQVDEDAIIEWCESLQPTEHSWHTKYYIDTQAPRKPQVGDLWVTAKGSYIYDDENWVQLENVPVEIKSYSPEDVETAQTATKIINYALAKVRKKEVK